MKSLCSRFLERMVSSAKEVTDKEQEKMKDPKYSKVNEAERIEFKTYKECTDYLDSNFDGHGVIINGETGTVMQDCKCPHRNKKTKMTVYCLDPYSMFESSEARKLINEINSIYEADTGDISAESPDQNEEDQTPPESQGTESDQISDVSDDQKDQ